MAKKRKAPPQRKAKDKDGLLPREALFVLHFIETGNASEAYRRAGYKAKGDSVAVLASRMLGKVKVKDAVERARTKMLQEVELDVAGALQALNDVIRFDPADIYNPDASLKPITEWPKHARHVIRGVKEKDWGTEVTFPDKVRVAERIAEASGKLTRKVELATDLYKLLAEDAPEEDRS